MRLRKNPIFQTAMVAVLLLFSLFVAATVQAQGPGGVDTNLRLWFKANAGVTESGGSVSSWADQSPNASITEAAQGDVARQPTLVDDVFNFNPALRFTEGATSDYLQLNSIAGLPTGSAPITIIAVANQTFGHTVQDYIFSYGTENTQGQVALFGTSNNSDHASISSWFGGAGYYEEPDFTWNDDPRIMSGIYLSDRGYLYSNGTTGGLTYPNGFAMTDGGSIAVTPPYWNTAGGTPNLGYIGTVPFPTAIDQMAWNGHIAELIVYSGALVGNNTDRHKIESYLALKYGLTFSNTNPNVTYDTHYLASDGSIVWDSNTNAGYNNDIAGLARDDASGLEQLQSKSINLGSVVEMTTTAFISDVSFIIWGNDNGSTAFGSTGAPSGSQIQARTWRVQVNANASGQQVNVCGPSAATHLLVDADGDFTSGATPYALTSNCTGATVTFNDGDYFTFADGVFATAPSQPVLIGPSGNITDTDQPIEFEWNPSTGPSSPITYTLTVTGPDGLVFTIETTDTTYIPDTAPGNDLPPGEYTWTVIATDPDGNASSAGSGSFTVVAPPTPLTFCPGGVCTPSLWLRADDATGGPTLTTWIDLVGTNTFTVTGEPQLASEALNFNNVVSFDGDGDYLVGDTDITFVEAFAVAQTNVDGGRLLAGDGDSPSGSCGAYFFMRDGNHGILIGDEGPDYAFINQTPYFDDYRILNAALLGGTAGSDSHMAVNGAAYATQSYSGGAIDPFTRTPVVAICGNREVNSQFTGDIAEVIVYANELSAADRLKVDSYLALKYGVTLSDTLNYVLSDDTVVWDGTANAAYHNNVAGIVIDNASGLTQTKSSSVYSGSLVTMEATTLSDGQALVWGHNNLSTAFDQSADIYSTTARIWRVAETGSIGNVTLMVPDTFTATVLLVSDDTDFTTATAHTLSDDGNGNLTVSLNFTDGQYFAFGIVGPLGSDSDGDGIPDVDEDLDGDGNPGNDDSDGDGIPDYLDPDDDGDGTPTTDEDANNNGDPTDDDQDGDGIPDYLEPDNGDTDGDGNNDVNDPDDDGDGIPTANECPDGVPCSDTDGDGTPDYLDNDDDGDGIPTAEECPDGLPCPDTDSDGTPDYLDDDDDGDSVPTAEECPSGPECPDTDGDGTPDYLDDDDDGDTSPTEDEDANNNGDPTDDDQDGDGIPDYLETDTGDTDGDGNNDVNDPDDDGDGIPTADECPAGIPCPDTDSDGTPDYLDDDDDGDGIPTADECPAGPPCPDTDNDGTPDYLDNDNPIAVVTVPITGTTVATNTPIFEGTGEPGATITITDGEGNEICTTTVDSNGDWTCTPTNPLPEGEQTASIIQNVAGSTSLPTLVTFTVDTTLETLDISLVPAPPLTATLGVTYTASFSIAGIPTGDTYTATLTEPDWLTLIDNGDGTFTLQGEPTMSGTFTVTLAVETSSGLTDTVSYQLEVDDGIFYTFIRFEGSYLRSALGITFTLAAFNDGPEAADGSQLEIINSLNLLDFNWACTDTNGGAVCPTDTGGTGTLAQTIPLFPVGSAVTFTVGSRLQNFLLPAQIEVGVIPGPDVVNLNPNQTFIVGDFVLILPVVFKNSSGTIAP